MREETYCLSCKKNINQKIVKTKTNRLKCVI